MGARILVVEDEPLIAEDIAQSLKDMGYEVTGICESADEAMASIKGMRPDMALLDINIEGAIDGIMLAAMLKSEFDLPFIFITSNSDSNTIERLTKLNPSGFLSKPYNEKTLYGTLSIALSREAEKNVSPSSEREEEMEDILFVRNKDRMERVEIEAIDYLQAYDNYCFLHVNNKRFLLPHTLKVVESKLDGNKFMRTHRSYVVNLHRISAIDELGIEVGGERLPLSKSQRKELLRRIQLL